MTHTKPIAIFARYARLVALLLALSALRSSAQEPFSIAEHYTKHEYMIPMRDGVRLFTAVYTPKDTAEMYPFILTRTPYSAIPYGENEFPAFVGTQGERMFQEGYIVVVQDVRGRYMSEGEFVNVRPYISVKKSKKDIDETTDTYDTVDWLVKNIPYNNGRVGITGISYPGFYTSMGTIDAHPAVKATSPQAPVSKWMGGDDFFHNGAFLLPHAFNFYAWFGKPRPKPKSTMDVPFNHGTPDEYKFFLEMGPLPYANKKYLRDSVAFWNEIMQHGMWDSFWEARNILPHLKNIRPATLVVGGWYDSENLFGALNTYASIEKQNPNNRNMLVMGPWYHGQWGAETGDSLGHIQWGFKTGLYYLDSIIVPFFDYYLKGKGEPRLAEAMVFETGNNTWRFLESWPPKNVTSANVYLTKNSRLSFEPPEKSKTGELEYDEYLSDPAKPVPYTAEITHWYNPAFPVEDQRFASKRPDVLVYQSDVLANELTLAGPIIASLFVSTSGTDSDWIVKVIDVYPDTVTSTNRFLGAAYDERTLRLKGYQMMVRGDVIRGKFRNSLSKPEPFEPNKVTKVEFVLNDLFHTFKTGHRVMVQIQSTWFPMIDRNPQKFVDIYNAKESDFQKATQRVYRSATWSSHLQLPVLK